MFDVEDLYSDGDTPSDDMQKIVHMCMVSRVWFVEHILGVQDEYVDLAGRVHRVASGDPVGADWTLRRKGIEDWQREVLEALDAGETRISIRSGHGVGKTCLCAWVIVHFILFRANVKVAVTAPSSKQMDDGLIPECNLWIRRLPAFLRTQLHVTDKRIERIDDGTNHFVSFRTARADAPEALAGIHADHVLAVVDEASGVHENVYEAAQGTMSTPGAIFILIGNPTRAKGYFYKTHTTTKHKWWTRKVACHDSSRVDEAFIAEIAATWGVDSNQYRVRVLGEFPTVDAHSLIPLDYVQSAVGRDVDIIMKGRVWGIDPGRGGDPTGFCDRTQNAVLDLYEWHDADTMLIANRVKEKWDETPDASKPEAVFVDTIGLGAGVADRLRELGLPVVDVNVAESPSIRSKYVRLRAEIWYAAREWFEGRDVVLPKDLRLLDQFVEELTDPQQVFASNGKNDVESKNSMKARGVPSPNLADAFCMTFCYNGAVASGRGRGRSAWDQPLDYNPDYVA